MMTNSIRYRGIRGIILLFLLFSINIYAQIEFSNLDTNSNVMKKTKKSSMVLSKSSSDGIQLGDYVWFDYNLNGIQDKGEIGLANVKVKLFNTADCSGTHIQETVTSNLGYYEFKNLTPTTDEYCIAVEYPNYWKATKPNQGEANFDSNVIESANGIGKIKNILVSYNDNSLDIGLHHKDTNCQALGLEVGAIGKYAYANVWGVKAWLEVEFNNVTAHGFCHEYTNGAPDEYDKYVVHSVDRLNFTEQQRDKLSRAFQFASDPEVIELFTKTFDKEESYPWIEAFHNIFIWYITDWNYSLKKLDSFIDEAGWFKNLTQKEKDSLKDIARLIVDKIDGTNGQTQYQPMKVYYLWNITSDKRQDVIVPETFLIPNQKECSGDSDPLIKVNLGDRVWLDSNKNGKQDNNEVGLQGIKVELYDTNGKLLSSTLTNKEGLYSFNNLDAGEYQVKFIKKAGYSFTTKKATGVSSSLNSDADISTGLTDTIFLEDENLDIDAGMYVTPQPSLTITKTTNDGNVSNIIVGDTITWRYLVKNSGNTIISNIKVTDDKEGAVACSNNTLNPTQSMTCTKVGVAILGAYKNIGKVEGVDPDGHKVTATDESSYVGHEAPVQLGSVGNYVWLDSNKNGIQDAGELPLSKVAVQLFNNSNKLIKSTKTNSSGEYEFKDIPASKYYVKFSIPSGYSITKKSQGSDNTKDSDVNSNGKTSLFELGAGQNRSDIDMGLYPTPANLGDRVWFDTNANGIQDSNEKRGVSGVTVKLYSEAKKLIATTKTNSRGEYILGNLTPGNYYVEFEVPNNYKVSPKKQGSNQSSDSNADKNGKTDIFTLHAGRDNKTIDMGLYQESTKIGDRVFYDLNKNGIQDSGENGVGDVTVKLFKADSGKLIKTTKTSASGIYLFEDIPVGEYYIEFTAPAGYTITDAHKGTKENDSDPDKSGRTENFTVEAGTQDSSIDMGIYQNVVSYGDRVFLDTNHNGLQDIGEKGVKNVKVTIFSANSSFKKSMLTDESGNYLFTHLSAGEYFAEFSDIPYGYLITKKDVNDNNNDLNDSDGFERDGKILTEVALLTPGVNDLSWDLGIYKTVCLPGKAVLGNLVWEDLNKDGVQDVGERGIANVTVTLYNNDTEEKVATTTTDENGLYEFPHLDPDFNYYVQFKVPAGYVVSPQDQEVDSIDSDADATGKTDVISLSADQINSSVDMGLYHKGATIGDRVFFDELNGASNGIQDESEQGVVDVKVTLYNAQGDVVQTTTTNANGEYHFTNVEKGNYTVGFSELPDGYIFTLKDQGSDEERDSDVKPNGRTDIIVVNGTEIITSVDAGLKKVKIGISSNDKGRGQTGKDVTVDVLANDVEGSYSFDPKTVRITSAPDGATLSEDGKTLTVPNEGVWSVDPETGAITFTPKDGFTGDPTPISYSVQDTQGNESSADVEIDYPPLARDDRVNAEVGKQIVIFVLDNDSQTSSPLDKASLRLIDPTTGDEVESVTVQGEGTWSTNIDGSVTFTPEDGFKNNPTPIKYVVRELSGDVSNQATITIVYPDAVDDVVIVPANHVGAITVNVAENDSNNTVANTVTIGCQQPGVQTLVVNNEGTWSVAENGVVTFTPIDGFSGDPTDIQYTIGLVSGERSNCATIDLRHELLAVDDSATLNVGGVSLINVLDNDSGALNIASVRLVTPANPVEGTTLSEDGRTLTVPNEGTWSVNDEGIVTFTAVDGFTSSPTPIGYTVENMEGIRSNVAQITLTEGGVTITANDDNATANGAEPVVLNVLDNDQGDINSSSVRFIDANGDEVRTLVVAGEGTWSVDNTGVVTFTGESGFVGTPTPVRYIVHANSAVLSDTATIRISGTCECTSYESSIPAMGQIAGVLMVLLTMLLSILFLGKEELFLIK